MIKTDFAKFQTLAEQGTIVPVYAEIAADLETPVSVLNRFKDDENTVLLESIEGGARIGRYSFIGVNAGEIFRVEDGIPYRIAHGKKEKLPFRKDALDALEDMVLRETFAKDPMLPPLPGGAAGYFTYETVGLFEDLPAPKSKLRTPECELMLVDEIIAFDNVRHSMKVIVCSRIREFTTLKEAYDNAASRVYALLSRLSARNDVAQTKTVPGTEETYFHPMTERSEFLDMVRKAREAIRQGELIQVVLSQEFTGKLPVSAFELYRALRMINPSPYTFFLKLGQTILVGSSPESMVKLTDGISCLRPIAGTRRRGETPDDDNAMEQELLHDEKECAEHLMLVDLGRNDLGRTAEKGSVDVKSFMTVEKYSHVMHLVSEVEARKRSDCPVLDLVRTTLPAGTLSGAPKIRALQMIHELESSARGVYGGAVGYLSFDGNLDLAIAIRTIEIHGQDMVVRAGAGIVYDSDPQKEYEETLNKANALFQSVKLAARGLEL